MAKELFKPLYSPPGWKYADAKAAGTLRESETYWIRLWDSIQKRTIRESTGTNNLEAAREYLRKKRGALDSGKPYVKGASKVTFGDMATHLREDCDSNNQHRPTLDARLAHLSDAFGNRRMATLRGADITAYRAARQRTGASAGTINRELQTLARAFTLGRKLELINETTLQVRSYRLAEAPPRSGFFEPDQFSSVLAHLTHLEVHTVEGAKRRKKVRVPAHDLRLACTIAYRLGWRMQSEVLTLEKRQIDLGASGGMGEIRLDPGQTKNDDGRIVVLTPDLRTAIMEQLARLDAFQRASGRVVRYLFTHTVGEHAGERIRDFRRAWATACRAAGVPGRLRHDFRRTAVRNMVNATVPERVAMKITGHRTRSIFDRYHIVSPGDLQRAAHLMTQDTPTANGRDSARDAMRKQTQ